MNGGGGRKNYEGAVDEDDGDIFEEADKKLVDLMWRLVVERRRMGGRVEVFDVAEVKLTKG